jgi:predicted metal-dependent phosphoesterase TrpH
LIDLHTHTTASDGLCTPGELVTRATTAGVTVLSVTDHDTLAGCEEAAAACATAGVEFVPGIEVTAIGEGTDVHVLGYFVDAQCAAFQEFLAEQRRRRIDRVRLMIDRLRTFGIMLDADALLQTALDDRSHAVGRPAIARALVDAGVVRDTNEAFTRWLRRGAPAFVPREGAAPAKVFSRIHDAGGLASLAHPGLLARDTWIPAFVETGLDALEAFHSEHTEAATAHYLDLAARFGLLVTGGSDFHGDAVHGALRPGSVSLPAERFATLKSRRRPASRATAAGSPTSS